MNTLGKREGYKQEGAIGEAYTVRLRDRTAIGFKTATNNIV